MKCGVIFNPHSGKGKKLKRIDYIVRRLQTKFEVELLPTQKPKHAFSLARDCCGKMDVLVVIGGDGTLSEVINGIAREPIKPIIGIIPKGTVNDVAHSLNISRNYKKAVEKILKGKPIFHDIFKVNNNYGIYVCCAGVMSETSYATSQKAKKRLGKAAYALHGIKKIFKHENFPLEISFEGGKTKLHCAFMMILNSRNVASFRINPHAMLDDGKVDILLVSDKFKRTSPHADAKILSMFLHGLKRQGLRLKLDNFHVSLPKDVIINIDGEAVGNGEFDFKVLKNEIKIIV